MRRNFVLRFSTAANDFGCVCDVVVAVFGVFDDGFAVFVDFTFSSATGGASRKIQNLPKRNRDREHQKRPKRHPKRIKIVRRLTIRHIFVDHLFLLRNLITTKTIMVPLRNAILLRF